MVSQVTPYVKSLYQRAQGMGLGVDLDQVLQRKATSPAQLGQFISKFTEQFGGDGNGAPASALTPDVMAGAKARLGAEFGRLLGDGKSGTPGVLEIHPTLGMLGDLAKLMADARAAGETEVLPVVRKVLDRAATGGPITGPEYQGFTQWNGPISNLTQSDRGTTVQFGQRLGSILDDAMSDSAAKAGNPQDIQALATARRQWKAFNVAQALAKKGRVAASARTNFGTWLPADIQKPQPPRLGRVTCWT